MKILRLGALVEYTPPAFVFEREVENVPMMDEELSMAQDQPIKSQSSMNIISKCAGRPQAREFDVQVEEEEKVTFFAAMKSHITKGLSIDLGYDTLGRVRE